ncbi:MAG: thiamine pyrophosphate-binding protein [Ilumatobacteraceae bacterium]
MDPSEALVAAVRRGGGNAVFGVPGGGSNLDLVGAATDAGMRFVLVHAESSGAIAAAAYGLVSDSVGLAIGTRGPGTTSLANGAAQATLDRFPLVLATDCVSSADFERVAHQRLDQRAMMRPITKWSATLGLDPQPTADRAVDIARSAPAGAVHLDIDASTASTAPSPGDPAPIADDPDDELSAIAGRARHPLVIAGIGALVDAPSVRSALEQIGAPVLTTYQAAGLLPAGHRLWAGLYTSGAIEREINARADLVVTGGLDTVEPMPAPWYGSVPVISLDAELPPSSFVPVTRRCLGPVAASLRVLVDALADHDWPVDVGRTERERTHDLLRGCTAGTFGPLELVDAVLAAAPDGIITTVDAGAHFLAVMPIWPVLAPHRLLISNGLATMGFAVPAAIGAAIARPGEPVLAFVGDGGLSMTLAELETIARYRLPITVVVFDDATLSLIEIKQRSDQGGAGAVRYADVDYAGVARAMGLSAVVAESAADVAGALEGGWDGPRLVDARIDPGPYRAIMSTVRG